VSDHWILNEKHEAVRVDLETWATWFEKGMDNRRVASTHVGGGHISTVFLGLDHSFGGGAPILFETLVFGGPLDEEMTRYGTCDEAVAGHAAMVSRAESLLDGTKS